MLTRKTALPAAALLASALSLPALAQDGPPMTRKQAHDAGLAEERPGAKPMNVDYHNRDYYHPMEAHPIYFENEAMGELEAGGVACFEFALERGGMVEASFGSDAFPAFATLSRVDEDGEAEEIDSGHESLANLLEPGRYALEIESDDEDLDEEGEGFFQVRANYYPLVAEAPLAIAPDAQARAYLLANGVALNLGWTFAAGIDDAGEYGLALLSSAEQSAPEGVGLDDIEIDEETETVDFLFILEPGARLSVSASRQDGAQNSISAMIYDESGEIVSEGEASASAGGFSFVAPEEGEYLLSVPAYAILNNAGFENASAAGGVQIDIGCSMALALDDEEEFRVYSLRGAPNSRDVLVWSEIAFESEGGLVLLFDEQLNFLAQLETDEDGEAYGLSAPRLGGAESFYHVATFSEEPGFLSAREIHTQGDAPLSVRGCSDDLGEDDDEDDDESYDEGYEDGYDEGYEDALEDAEDDE